MIRSSQFYSEWNQLILTTLYSFSCLIFLFPIQVNGKAFLTEPSEVILALRDFEQAKNAVANSEFDTAMSLFSKALPILEKYQKLDKYADASIDFSVLLYWKGQHDEAYQQLVKLKTLLEKNNQTTTNFYGLCLVNLAVIYYNRNDLDSSLTFNKRAIDILEKNQYDRQAIYKLLSNLALTQEYLGDHSAAIVNLKRALAIQLDELGSKDKEVVNTIYELGVMLANRNKYSKSISEYHRCLDLLPKTKFINNSEHYTLWVKILQRMAESQLKISNFDSAAYYLNEINFRVKDPGKIRGYLTSELWASLFLANNSYARSIDKGRRAIQQVHTHFKNRSRSPVIARQYTHLGEIYQANNQLDSAAHYFHQAFLYLAHGFENEDIYSNPMAEQCFMEYKVIRSLRGKARAMYLRFQGSKDIRDLLTSLETYELTHEFIKKLKEDITTMGSKQRLAGDALPIYEEAITTALALHKVTGKGVYLEKALFFAESNKAILLLESMNERMAQSVSGIPNSLLEQEKQFRVDIAYYEKEINDERNKKETESEPEKLKKSEDKLYELRREYQQLIDQFEEQYPKYYRLKYDTKLATVQDIRRDMLNRKTAFLEYFVGVENIYLFEITKNNFSVHQFPKSAAFEQDIQTIHGMAKKMQLNTEEIPIFQTKIRKLYVQYLGSCIDNLPKSINRLLIVPDDLLNLVPFEILSPTESKTDYLIQDFTIGYAYSASLFQAGRKSDRGVAEQLFLGYAPAFSAPFAENRDCRGDRLSNLANSQREVEGIQALLGGDVVVGTMANRDSFLKQAANYRIIHLATHACMDKENPMQSKVFFADDPIVNQDLFNLHLAADLAVLSACNTGSGQLVKGDGVLSLSKGFVHAGCPSAVISLWSVDDFSASEIMIDFYAYLKKGFSKDKALRQAKLNFITAADKVKKHPFFWAAFIQMGDPAALDFGQKVIPWRLLLTLAILLLAGGFMLWRSQRVKTKWSV